MQVILQVLIDSRVNWHLQVTLVLRVNLSFKLVLLNVCLRDSVVSASSAAQVKHCGKRIIWQHIHSPVEGTQNRASRKEDSTIKDKHSRQFSDGTVIYWFCRQGGV